MEKCIFNLDDYRIPGSKIFTGRDIGLDVKNKSNINTIFDENEKIEFIIPDNLFSINPSFFEELFIDIVLKNGKEIFFNKMVFINKGKYQFEKPLNEAIDRILREKTALD